MRKYPYPTGSTPHYCPYCRRQSLSKKYLWDAKSGWSKEANCIVTREGYVVVCLSCGKQHIEHETRPQLAKEE